MKAFLLFTNHDFGHSFDGQEMTLIALVAEKKLVYKQDYTITTLGQGASERTSSSSIPTLFGEYRYHYVIDGRTYSTVSAINEGFQAVEYLKNQEANDE